jgi:hypothetical protein
VVASLLRFQPSVILYVGGEELVEPVIAAYEAQRPSSAPAPYFVSAAELVAGERLARWVAGDSSRRRRFFGVSAPATSAANVKFTTRYNEAFHDELTPATSPAAPYDAVYLAAYALATLDDSRVEGAAVAGALARLVPPGKRIEVGPSAIFDAIATLRRGENLDLDGAGNPLDFDLATGESLSELVIECLAPAQAGALQVIESGMRFSATSKRLEGELRCP